MINSNKVITRANGFTLLEVIIAMAILSVSLVAIAGINSGAIDAHVFAKKLTIATMLARSKMSDLETQLLDDWPMDDSSTEGTFEDEGFAEFSWKAQILRPKTENMSTDQLMALFNNSESPNSADSANAAAPEGQPSSGSLFGSLLAANGGGTADSALAALASGAVIDEMMKSQLQSMIDLLGKSMREVRLTVFWKTGSQQDQFTVTTHLVNMGKEGESSANAKNPSGSK
jgi:general secretion pathway protein I